MTARVRDLSVVLLFLPHRCGRRVEARRGDGHVASIHEGVAGLRRCGDTFARARQRGTTSRVRRLTDCLLAHRTRNLCATSLLAHTSHTLLPTLLILSVHHLRACAFRTCAQARDIAVRMANADYKRLVSRLIKERKPVPPFNPDLIPAFEDENESGEKLNYLVALAVTLPYMRKGAHSMAPVSAVDAASMKFPAFGALAGRAMADANKNLHFAVLVMSMLRESRRLMDFMAEHELLAFALKEDGSLAFDFTEAESTLKEQLDEYDLDVLRKTLPFSKPAHVVVRDRGTAITNSLDANYPDAHQLNCSRHGAEDLSKYKAAGKRALQTYHPLTMLRQGVSL